MNFYEDKRAAAHALLDSVIDTLIAKNTDYGDSFSITGRVGASTRIFDKAMRLHTLSVNSNAQQVKDEAIEDTAMDLFAYALMYQLKFNKKSMPSRFKETEEKCSNVKQFPIDIDSYILMDNQVYRETTKTFTSKQIIQSGKSFGKLLGVYVCYNFLYGFIQEKIANQVVADWDRDIREMLDLIQKKNQDGESVDVS